MLSAVARSISKKTRPVIGRNNRKNILRSFSSAEEVERKLYEIRTYQLKPEHLMDYLALTGSEAFAPRTEASKCNGFFVLEMGDVLNSVCHFWEYESFDHRTDVRAALASDKGFGEYITTIRPWLVSQHSIMTEGWLDVDTIENGQNGKYLLQKLDFEYNDVEDGPDRGECQNVGHFETLVGNQHEIYILDRADSFEGLTTGIVEDAVGGIMMAPSGFSLAQ
jgi:hypothetical protein